MKYLFRGKDINTDKWVYGYLAEIETAWDNYNGYYLPTEYAKVIIRTDVLTREHVEVIPETVGQFTGRMDCNGKKIFEGDTVAVHQFLFDEIEGIVVYSPESMCFCLELTEVKEYMGYEEKESVVTPFCNFYGLHEDSFKVVGNIHDDEEQCKQ